MLKTKVLLAIFLLVTAHESIARTSICSEYSISIFNEPEKVSYKEIDDQQLLIVVFATGCDQELLLNSNSWLVLESGYSLMQLEKGNKYFSPDKLAKKLSLNYTELWNGIVPGVVYTSNNSVKDHFEPGPNKTRQTVLMSAQTISASDFELLFGNESNHPKIGLANL